MWDRLAKRIPAVGLVVDGRRAITGFSDRTVRVWNLELYKVSKRIFIIDDFHGQTERGVKQELFAHFVLIT